MPKTQKQVERNSIFLQTSKNQHIHFGTYHLQLCYSKSKVELIPLTQVTSKQNLIAIVQNTFNPLVYVNAALAKTRSMLAFIQKSFKWLTQGVLLQVTWFEYFVKAWLLTCARSIDSIMKLPEIATRSILSFRHVSNTEQWHKLKLFSLWWRRLFNGCIQDPTS